MFGGNSNWRGPIWFPMNMMLIRALLQFYSYYGDSFQVECPTGSGRTMTLFDVAHEIGGEVNSIRYEPAKSEAGMFGGNSNWRGPIWMPVNALIVRGLLNLHAFYGDDFTVECPTGSGHRMTLFEVAHEISRRLAKIFLRDENGRRPVYGGSAKFQEDPHWRDLILFY